MYEMWSLGQKPFEGYTNAQVKTERNGQPNISSQKVVGVNCNSIMVGVVIAGDIPCICIQKPAEVQINGQLILMT